MKKLRLIFLTIISMLIFMGCDEYTASISSNCICINDDGTVDAVIIEDFDQSYYSEDELMNMVNEEVSAFNSNGQGSMNVVEHKLDNGKMNISLKFNDFDSYNSYMPESVYIGTVGGAYEQGMDFDRSLWVVGKGESTIGKNNLFEMENEKLIVVSGEYMVRCPSKIKYYSQGMYILDANTVISDKPGMYFVIYK